VDDQHCGDRRRKSRLPLPEAVEPRLLVRGTSPGFRNGNQEAIARR